MATAPFVPFVVECTAFEVAMLELGLGFEATAAPLTAVVAHAAKVAHAAQP